MIVQLSPDDSGDTMVGDILSDGLLVYPIEFVHQLVLRSFRGDTSGPEIPITDAFLLLLFELLAAEGEECSESFK